MSAAASGHSAAYVLWEMPLAQALQFAAAWLEIQGNTTHPLSTTAVDSDAFGKIANR